MSQEAINNSNDPADELPEFVATCNQPQAAEWGRQLLRERADLTNALRHERYTFEVLMEVATQINSFSFRLRKMAAYLASTLRGQFAVSRVQILRVDDTNIQHFREIRRNIGNGNSPALELDIAEGLTDRLLKIDEPLRLDHDEDLARLGNGPELQELVHHGTRVLLPLVHVHDDEARTLHGLLCLDRRIGQRPYTPDDMRLLKMLGRMIAISLHNELLYRRSTRDYLTGVSSRGFFDMQLARELDRVHRYGGGPIALLMLDIDHFKRINDTFGHQTGDRALAWLARTLRQSLRVSDDVARYGGEEFAIILLNVSRSQAAATAERLRLIVAERQVDTTAEDVSLTVSIGVALHPDDAVDATGLIRAADEALYKAKRNGRNRAVMATPLPK